MAVSSIISAFSDKAGNAITEMKKAETTMKDSATANNTETVSVKQARATLEINIAKLKDFHGTKQQEKKIVEEMNDTYGHQAGDDVLRRFAQEVRSIFRQSDHVGRFGGDDRIPCGKDEYV